MLTIHETPDTMTFSWEMTLKSTPEAIWHYLADTDRLNHDLGFSAIKRINPEAEQDNNRRIAQQIISGFLVQEWQEEPFQWTRPHHYNTLRVYRRGIFQRIGQNVTLTEQPDGGTHLVYNIIVTPKYKLLRGAMRNSFKNLPFESVLNHYDDIIQQELANTPTPTPFKQDPPPLSDTASERLASYLPQLIDYGISETTARRLLDHIRTADDLSLMRIKPYALADFWQLPRQQVLEACMIATRAGLLNLSWDLICPHCRGAKDHAPTLNNLSNTTHCESCHIDFTIDFERSVELTFQPNEAIRPIERVDYCVGGPQLTPHIHIQHLLQPDQTLTLNEDKQPSLPIGRHRIRTQTLQGGQFIRVAENGLTEITLHIDSNWPKTEPAIAPNAVITLHNTTPNEQLIILEHLEWSDQSVTAADVTTRQIFRDLFSSEALRPNDQITLQSITLVFTDLRSSTAMYQDLGDAPAFGTVMSHFDVLRAAIREEEGAIVKTIGDAVMAAFRNPDNAIRAMLRAQQELQHDAPNRPALSLRVGIHTGTCIAVTLNDRLDYFGTTVNTAARLEGKSDGTQVVISENVYNDPAVQHMLKTDSRYTATPFTAQLKGLGETQFQLYAISQND